jgi:hypothetical protein
LISKNPVVPIQGTTKRSNRSPDDERLLEKARLSPPHEMVEVIVFVVELGAT